MPRNFSSRSKSTRDDWQTPARLVRALGEFDLDPCANCENPTRLAQFGFTKSDDGLAQKWIGRVFVNPPYGVAARRWLNMLGRHGNGIALIPPRMGAKWFHEAVLENADAILFLKGRIGFIDPTTGKEAEENNADSILVAYGQANVRALKDSGLPGRIWDLRAV